MLLALFLTPPGPWDEESVKAFDNMVSVLEQGSQNSAPTAPRKPKPTATTPKEKSDLEKAKSAAHTGDKAWKKHGDIIEGVLNDSDGNKYSRFPY